LIRHDAELGRIARGARADLSFWDKEYHVIATMVGGRFVYTHPSIALEDEATAASVATTEGLSLSV
jgi:hypothetical protein